MTALYACVTDGFLPDGAHTLLPAWRRERMEKIRNPDGRRESLCAGLLLSYALRRHGMDPMEPVKLLPAGKPVLSGHKDMFFSLSHSGKYVLCAVGGHSVGTDVQEARPVNMSIARRFHPSEQAWLFSFPEEERYKALFRLWTRKEAWVKAVSGDRMLTLSEADVIHPVPGLYFRDYTLAGGYAAALCCFDPALPEEITEISTPALLGKEEEGK